jgi:hypothetical protein
MASIASSEQRATADLQARPEPQPAAEMGAAYDTDVLIVGLGPVGAALATDPARP